MRDPDLYLFLDDDEILARNDLPRLMHTVRRESAEPVLQALGPDEDGIGYSCVVREEGTGLLKLWYRTRAGQVKLAVSEDGVTWERRGGAVVGVDSYMLNCYSLCPVGPHAVVPRRPRAATRRGSTPCAPWTVRSWSCAYPRFCQARATECM